jgi:hypothetical protein
MKQILIDCDTELFNKYGLVFYPEVLVNCFDPYSLSPERDKVHFLLTDATLRIAPDGQVTLESLKHRCFISDAKAKVMKDGVPGVITKTPYHFLEYTDIYASKLEADLMTKPLIVIPEKIEAFGGLIPFNSSILESLICDALNKFRQDRQATYDEIVDMLTKDYPEGGGWYTRNATLLLDVKKHLEVMVNKGFLEYDSQTAKYVYVSKSSSSQIRR